MRSQLRSLVWKEWHERKWSLALGVSWIMVGVAYAVWYEAVHGGHRAVGSFYNISFIYGFFVAIFLAMRTSLGEVTEKTLGFSASLPVLPRLYALIRLGGAVVSLAAPIVLGALVMWIILLTGLIVQEPAWIPSPESRERVWTLSPEPLSGPEVGVVLWTVAATAMASGVELLLILSLIGLSRRDESHLGFIGACVAFVWLLCITLYKKLLSSDFLIWLGAVLPQTLVITTSRRLFFPRSEWLRLALNLLLMALLASLFVRRYAARSNIGAAAKPTGRWQLPPMFSRIPFRFSGRLASLGWLDLRQAVPMCLAGLLLACLMTAWQLVSHSHVDVRDPRLPFRIAGDLPGVAWAVALLWGAVVGSGVFASELRPELEQFWRSRPISPSAWFWVKFFAGLAAVLGVLDLLTIIVSWKSFYAEDPTVMSWAYIACMPLMHAMTYALAVLGTCWWRRPVAAAMVTVLLFWGLLIASEAIPGVAEFHPLHVGNKLSRDATLDLTRHNYPVVYGGIAAIIVLASLAAWRLALRPTSVVLRAGPS